MKMYLPFGDYWHCGHGQYKTVLVEVPNQRSVFEAECRVKEKYGRNFFKGFACDYDDPSFDELVWKALIETEYPVERFKKIDNTNEFDDVNSLSEVLSIDSSPCIDIDFCIDAYIWLVNAFGAEIFVLDGGIETISNCSLVGYGCFY